MFNTYDASNVSVTINDVILTGFSEDMLEYEKDEDSWTTKVGSQGDVVRSKINNSLATLTVTLLATSPQVPVLEALAQSGEDAKVFVSVSGPVNETITADQAFVKKPATRTYNNEVADRVYELQLVNPTLTSSL